MSPAIGGSISALKGHAAQLEVVVPLQASPRYRGRLPVPEQGTFRVLVAQRHLYLLHGDFLQLLRADVLE